MKLKIIFLLCVANLWFMHAPRENFTDFHADSEARKQIEAFENNGFNKFFAYANGMYYKGNLGQYTTADRNEVNAVHAMFKENPHVLMVAFETLPNAENIDVNLLQQKYNELKEVITGKNLKEIVDKYMTKINEQEYLDLTECFIEQGHTDKASIHRLIVSGWILDVDSYDTIIKTSVDKKKRIAKELTNPESALYKLMYYKNKKMPEMRAMFEDLCAVSREFNHLYREFKRDIPQLPDTHEDLFAPEFKEKIDKLEKHHFHQAMMLLAKEGLGCSTVADEPDCAPVSDEVGIIGIDDDWSDDEWITVPMPPENP